CSAVATRDASSVRISNSSCFRADSRSTGQERFEGMTSLIVRAKSEFSTGHHAALGALWREQPTLAANRPVSLALRSDPRPRAGRTSGWEGIGLTQVATEMPTEGMELVKALPNIRSRR